MPRRKEGNRVLGPYRNKGSGWRIIVCDGGERVTKVYPTRQKAERIAEQLRREMSLERPVNEAIDAYECYLRDVKMNKPKSYGETIRRLRRFFDGEASLGELTPKACQETYDRLVKGGLAADSHRNYLAESKTFLAWCVDKKWLPSNPLAEVKGVGKRRHGKPQLRIDEARAWGELAFAYADAGEPGAVAALIALYMDLRSSEIVQRVARDVDDAGTLLWIPDSKTEAGKRALRIPEPLQPYIAKLVSGRKAEDRIFDYHDRDWVRDWVQRICRESGVPVVCAHSMRGLHATLAHEFGETGAVVARAMGHEDQRTTMRSYITREAASNAKQERVLRVISGGVR